MGMLDLIGIWTSMTTIPVEASTFRDRDRLIAAIREAEDPHPYVSDPRFLDPVKEAADAHLRAMEGTRW
jgi:hypothetical protein